MTTGALDDPVAPGDGERHPRPTSRRGRALARGRSVVVDGPTAAGAVEMTGAGAPAAAGTAGAASGEAPAHLRGGARRARLQRRRRALLAGIVGLSITGAGLAVAGVAKVRTSTLGRYQHELGPDDPGYQASVVPTPTLAVLHRGADGELAGASLVALEPGDDGGSVIVVPAATLVAGAGGESTIAEIYGAEGPDAAARAVGLAVTVGVTEHVEVDDARWAELVGPVGSVEVHIDEPVDRWAAGTVTIEPDEVGAFLSALGDDETDLDRIDRQQIFWSAWLPMVADGGDGALPGETSTGLGRFVRSVANGDGSAAALPVVRDRTRDGALRTNGSRIGDFVAHTVPYPTAAAPGARVRVRVLNGTGDQSLTTQAARALVAGGAQITVAGNATSFDVAETSIVYAGADREQLAAWVGAFLGVERVEQASTGQDGQSASTDEVDVTVILGDDAEDLIER